MARLFGNDSEWLVCWGPCWPTWRSLSPSHSAAARHGRRPGPRRRRRSSSNCSTSTSKSSGGRGGGSLARLARPRPRRLLGLSRSRAGPGGCCCCRCRRRRRGGRGPGGGAAGGRAAQHGRGPVQGGPAGALPQRHLGQARPGLTPPPRLGLGRRRKGRRGRGARVPMPGRSVLMLHIPPAGARPPAWPACSISSGPCHPRLLRPAPCPFIAAEPGVVWWRKMGWGVGGRGPPSWRPAGAASAGAPGRGPRASFRRRPRAGPRARAM